MKSVQINATSGIGSTGKICESISNALDQRGIENYIFYTGSKRSSRKNAISYMSALEIKMNALFSRIMGNYGFQSKSATRKLIRHLEQIQPQIVHLHNLHGHNCNIELLFRYFREKNIKVIWTFHDCWAYTGYCTHYDMIQCEQWKTECSNCSRYKHYSWFFDRSNDLFRKKKALLGGVDLTVISPSNWLAVQARDSFLGSCDIRVIHNGINLDVFQPRSSDFRKRYDCDNKFLILGVAFDWGFRKGLDIFVELEKRLGEDCQIVLVGTNDAIDKQLPAGIISIHRTENQFELAEIYTAADLYVNPTREENYPTVNMEALACGTPVLTFRTGGSAEMIDESCGVSVEKNNTEALYRELLRIKQKRPFLKDYCVRKAIEFNEDSCFCTYAELYSELLER